MAEASLAAAAAQAAMAAAGSGATDVGMAELAHLRELRSQMRLLATRCREAEKSLYYLNERQASVSGLTRDWQPHYDETLAALQAAQEQGDEDGQLAAKKELALIKRQVRISKIKGTCFHWLIVCL